MLQSSKGDHAGSSARIFLMMLYFFKPWLKDIFVQNKGFIMADKKMTSYPKEKINILFLENISDAAVQQFTNAGYSSVKKLSGAVSESELIKEIKNVHILGHQE
jgi:hypothetical protein